METVSDLGATQPGNADDVHVNVDVNVDLDAILDTAHLARFEFSDAGTKVLMVEWTPTAIPNKGTGDEEPSAAAAAAETPAATPAAAAASPDLESGWQVSWAGKSAGTFLRSGAHIEPPQLQPPSQSTTAPSTASPKEDAAAAAAAAAAAPRRRVFFLLPPPTPVPATITLTPPRGTGAPPIELKPLPAIFPEGFMDVESGQGTRGVLHTIWAKQRVRELEREMDAEMRANAESVGLDMALAERQWIVDTFLRPPPAAAPAAAIGGSSQSRAPVLPRTPTGSRLGEKLKGLRLGTSPTDLVPSPTANTFTTAGSQSQTLSPQGTDIAVSSFSSMAAMARPPFSSGQGAQAPLSLDAALKGDIPPPPPEREEEDDLFALPMSPRSPEMKRSPFSILR